MRAAEKDKNSVKYSDDVSALCNSFENHYKNRIQAAKSVLSIADIYVEYDWPEHEGKYFLATYEDAKKRYDALLEGDKQR